jgi:hypothetical protein
VHPDNHFDLLTRAISELLAEHAGRISDADLDELADSIAEFVVGRERDRAGAGADLSRLDEWLSQSAMRLDAQMSHTV